MRYWLGGIKWISYIGVTELNAMYAITKSANAEQQIE